MPNRLLLEVSVWGRPGATSPLQLMPVPRGIELGQTAEQVMAILGSPKLHYEVGASQIYIFGRMQITFTDGKVSDIQ